jgi:hypothetical protein
VSKVQILIDGNVVGNATLGFSRADVASARSNPAYLHAGWTFTYPASGLSLGSHTVSAVAYNSVGLSATLKTLTITVAATGGLIPPLGWVDQAVDAVTLSTTIARSDNLFVSGWAADPQDGAPVTSVKVLIDGREVGSAVLGKPRSDVAAAYSKPAYLNSGWSFTYAASNLSTGTHTVTAVAYDSLGLSNNFETKTITVQ